MYAQDEFIASGNYVPCPDLESSQKDIAVFPHCLLTKQPPCDT